MLQVQQVSKTFGKTHALSSVSLQIESASLAVMGPPGAGKSVLLALMAGLEKPSSGSVLLDGVELRAASADARKKLAYLPADPEVFPRLHVVEALEYVALLHRLDHGPARQLRVDRVCERFVLTGLRDRPVRSLSPGGQRRVALAAACLGQPSVLLVDEPTRGLSPAEALQVRLLLAELARECILVYTTNSVSEATELSPRLAALRCGALRFFGTWSEALSQLRGRFWAVDLPSGGPRPILEGFTPTGFQCHPGGVRLRGAAETKPTETAVPLEPTPEDAYAWLLERPDDERQAVAAPHREAAVA